MATRNPMNQRYQGDGPGGQTRKSASSAKPKAKAASSVHIQKKPTTPQEKKMAAKQRQKEAEEKARQKAAKQAERAKASGIVIEIPKKKPIESVKSYFGIGQSKSESMPQDVGAAQANDLPSTGSTFQTRSTSFSAEARMWRKRYWILIAIGFVAVIFSFIFTYAIEVDGTVMLVFIVIAYGTIISAFIIDFRKVRPLNRKAQSGASARKTPKEMKHEQEAQEQAAAVEAARKAQKGSKKGPRRKAAAVADDDLVKPSNEEYADDEAEPSDEGHSGETQEKRRRNTG